jgi:antitoxin (DNA-binding transcriptional repressor) of toxin-antitoxin stability system
MQTAVALKEFRQDVEKFAGKVARGMTLVVTKRSRPLFRVAPVDDGIWEEVVDFTKFKRGGIRIEDLLGRLSV